MELCRNIVSFKCTVNDALSSFLLALQGRERLQDIRIHARVSFAQADKLVQLVNLRTLALDYGSGSILDRLPKWTLAIQDTLTNLVLYVGAVNYASYIIDLGLLRCAMI
jgi:hypothetical protein